MAKTEAMRGGYVLGDVEQRERRERQYPNGIPPQFRIVREASLDAGNISTTKGWHNSIDALEKKNRLRGHASVYGGIVLTYVGAEDMRRMLVKKNPQLFDGGPLDRQTHYMEKMRDEFKGFVRRHARIVTDQQNAFFEEAMLRESLFVDLDDVDEAVIRIGTTIEGVGATCADDLVGLWGHAKVPLLPDLEGFGKSKMGLVLGESAQAENIEREREDILVWLRANRLDTNLMQERAERPHISVYQIEKGLGAVGIFSVPMPRYIELCAPIADINTNSMY